jgi:hypothetical protein
MKLGDIVHFIEGGVICGAVLFGNLLNALIAAK